jgi:hypothetical protein
MRIRFEQPYVPEDGPQAIARLWRQVEWDAPPAVGDFVHHSDGPVATQVDRIFWDTSGRALVHLHGNPQDGPTFSDTDLANLESFGWVPVRD